MNGWDVKQTVAGSKSFTVYGAGQLENGGNNLMAEIIGEYTENRVKITEKFLGDAITEWGFNKDDIIKDLQELKRYREIGLTPEEVKQLHDENISIRNWNACEKELFEKYQADSKKLIEVEAKLDEYKDLEEQGLLIKLACKVGDTVYDIYEFIENRNSPDIFEYEAKEITIGKDRQGNYYIIDSTIFRDDDFGKTVFLTREEAEKALKESGEK